MKDIKKLNHASLTMSSKQTKRRTIFLHLESSALLFSWKTVFTRPCITLRSILQHATRFQEFIRCPTSVKMSLFITTREPIPQTVREPTTNMLNLESLNSTLNKTFWNTTSMSKSFWTTTNMFQPLEKPDGLNISKTKKTFWTGLSTKVLCKSKNHLRSLETKSIKKKRFWL